MQAALNHNQLQYVLFHLNQHIDLTDEIRNAIQYTDQISDTNAIIFKRSNMNLRLDKQIEYQTESIPNIFPVGEKKQWFELEGNALIFYHDILKATFYLLSGYQEYKSESVDHMDRFKYKNSIQEQLQIVQKPIVNYYFQIISEGIELYCNSNNISFKRKRLFDNYGFMLTHDVDRVDYYHWRETAYKVMQLLGLKKAHYDKKRLAKSTLNAIIPSIFPGYKEDPWWNFKELRQLEKSLNLKSVWYLLNRDGSPHDAKYNLEEPRIRQLINKLETQGCEVGLHGSIKTATNDSAFKKAKNRLDKLTSLPCIGTRQHFLKFHYPLTLQIQINNGLKYDTSMGYAEHEGFRNSYCYAFKPYDHANNRMMDIWELPLTIMDTTLFSYRKLNYNEMNGSFKYLIEEIKKFGGLMVMLWHNCNFDEYEYPGIKNYYYSQLQAIAKTKPESVTGVDVLQRLLKLSV